MSRNMEITVDGNELSAKANTGNKQWVAVITGTHPQYNYDREFVCYQKPKTSKRDSGSETVEDGTVVEYVRYTHSGKNRKGRYYQIVGGELHQIDEDDVKAALEEIVVDVAPEPRDVDFDELDSCITEVHECEACGKAFDSAHGVAIHTGMVHSEDDEADEQAADAEPARAVADGGVGVDDYDIDPTELDYDAENRTKDSQNNRTNCVSRIKGTDLWVAYRTWQTGPSEYDSAIKGIGRVSFKSVDLDTDHIAEAIRGEAERMFDGAPDDDEEAAALADELTMKADELAEALEKGWQYTSTEYTPRDDLHEGMAAVDGTTAWVSHVEEAIGHEAADALEEVGIGQDDHGSAMDIAKQALYEGVQQRRDRWRRPHLDYEARLTFDVEPWELRALELQQQGVFSSMPETARVYALLETGMRKSDIADKLDVNPSTVTRHSNRAEEWIGRAEWTAENVER